MIITVQRKYYKDTYTIGNVYVDGTFFCNSMEDKDRGLTQDMSVEDVKKKKVYGETAIPKGTYTVSYTYSNKFKKMMPLINNVKGFEGIRIHSGNTAKDSLGCILLGENKAVGKVLNSRVTCNKLYALIEKAISRKEPISIVIE